MYLNETLGEANDAFQACERGYRRLPPLVEQKAGPADDRDLLVTRVLVLPFEAEVDVDGVPHHRRDGFIEVSGKRDEKKKVHVLRGTYSINVNVTSTPRGARPPIIDLRAVLARKRLMSNKPADDDALTPLAPGDL